MNISDNASTRRPRYIDPMAAITPNGICLSSRNQSNDKSYVGGCVIMDFNPAIRVVRIVFLTTKATLPLLITTPLLPAKSIVLLEMVAVPPFDTLIHCNPPVICISYNDSSSINSNSGRLHRPGWWLFPRAVDSDFCFYSHCNTFSLQVPFTIIVVFAACRVNGSLQTLTGTIQR